MTIALAMDRISEPWIGRRMLRREDLRLVTGRGTYVDDLRPAGCLHVHFLRGTARGTIRRMDLEGVRAAPGVVAVFTAADLAAVEPSSINRLMPDMVPVPMQIFASGPIEAPGQLLAAVVATSLDAARDAEAALDLDVDVREPIDPGAGPEVLSQAWQTGDVAALLDTATHRIKVMVRHPLVAPMPLEPRAALADWQDGRLTAWLSTQTPHRARDDLARMLGLAPDIVRVIAPDVGGAFGGKASIYPEDVVIAFAAWRLGRPVKWCATRGEDLLAATQGRGATSEGEIAVSEKGLVLGLRARLAFQQGYWMPFSAVVPARNAGRILPGPYRVAAVDIGVSGRLTSRAPVGIYRGAGRPEATMLIERLMDDAARALGRDPLAFREQNIIGADAFPYVTSTGETLDSANFALLLQTMRATADYETLVAACRQRRAAGEIVGLGVALYIEPCGQGWESAKVSLQRDGVIVAATGSSAQGQGRETAFAQIVADALGIAPAAIDVQHGDTATVDQGIGALASRSTAIGGSAMLLACRALRDQAAQQAGRLLQCDPALVHVGADAAARPVAANQRMSWTSLAHLLGAEMTDPSDETTLSASLVYHADGESWASGCCLAVVAIDEASGETAIERLIWVDDAGTIVNPLLVKGQLIGGMAQGFGEAMMEQVVYDDGGQLLTGSLMDYAMPRAIDVPPVTIATIATRSPSNALGAKGVGEAGCIGIPAAIVNAVCDALAPFGMDDVEMPLTSERIWRVLRQAANHRRHGEP